VRVMLLPKSFDPDSLIRHEGAGQFVERVNTATLLSDYFLNGLPTVCI